VGAQEVRWDRGGTAKSSGFYFFSMEKRMKIINSVQGFLYNREQYHHLKK
jgi:hypothetical protein